MRSCRGPQRSGLAHLLIGGIDSFLGCGRLCRYGFRRRNTRAPPSPTCAARFTELRELGKLGQHTEVDPFRIRFEHLPTALRNRVDRAPRPREQAHSVQVCRGPADPVIERPSQSTGEPFSQLLFGQTEPRRQCRPHVGKFAALLLLRTPPATGASGSGNQGRPSCQPYSMTRLF